MELMMNSASDCKLVVTDDDRSLEPVINLVRILLNNKGTLDWSDNGDQALLSLAYAIPDKRYFLAMLELCSDALIFLSTELGRSLVISMVDKKEWDVIQAILDKCNTNDLNEDFIADFAVRLFMQNEKDTFKNIFFKYIPDNRLINDSETFLTRAIKNVEDDECIKSIIRSSFFDINKCNKFDETPLIVACQKLRIEIVKTLIQNGCNVKYKNNHAVDIVVKALSNEGQDHNIATDILKMLVNSHDIAGDEIAMEEDSILSNQFQNDTCLQPSCSDTSKIIDIIRAIVSNSGDIYKSDSDGKSPIFLAYELSDKRIFTLLIESTQMKLGLLDTDCGQELFMKIIEDNNLELFEKLFNSCEILERHDELLLTLALAVLKRDNYKIYMLILTKCVNRNKILSSKETFSTSLLKENINEQRIIEVVMSDLLDLNVTNELGETPLIMASRMLKVKVVKALLHQGSDVTLQNCKAMEVAVISAINGSEQDVISKNAILMLCSFFLQNKCEGKGRERNISSISETNVTPCQMSTSEAIPSVLTKYHIDYNDKRRSPITSLLEMFIFSLFFFSDNMDHMFHRDKDNLNNTSNARDNEDNLDNTPNARELRDFLSTNIIYPLRKYGSINATAFCSLIGLIKKSKLLLFRKRKDIDVSDIMILFSILFPEDNLLIFENINSSNSYHLSLTINSKKSSVGICVQDLLNFYIIRNNTFFKEIPKTLILEIPRYFNLIIPTSVLEVSNLLVNSYKKCFSCGECATFSCFKCVEARQFDLRFGLFCDSHECTHPQRNPLPTSEFLSKLSVQMNLQSIICYENDHFVALIRKCDFKPQWLTFSSSSGPNVPSVTFELGASRFLLLPDDKKKLQVFGRNPGHLRKITNNSYIYIYKNPTLSCY